MAKKPYLLFLGLQVPDSRYHAQYEVGSLWDMIRRLTGLLTGGLTEACSCWGSLLKGVKPYSSPCRLYSQRFYSVL